MPKLYGEADAAKKPQWLKIKLHNDPTFAEVERLVQRNRLHTICSSGQCPNKAECWSRRRATFMILGDVCTRNCRFCATTTGRPEAVDETEPQRVAESARLMELRHVVVTSVTRDDLPDGGAAQWARTVGEIRRLNPKATIELLIPDFDARTTDIDTVLASKPDIVGHNIETVERLTPIVRSRARYRTSLATLEYISRCGAVAKSGLMVGLGETFDETVQALADLREAGVRIVTIGQYLRPSLEHYPVAEYVTPETFERYREKALSMGFDYCASAPLVRSSYMADKALESIRDKQ